MPSHRVTHETLDGKVHYPDKLPRRRGSWSTYGAFSVICVIVASCLAGMTQKSEELVSFFVCLGCVITAHVVLELLWRATYYVEEWHHVKSRHKGSHWHLLYKLLLMNFWATWLYIAGCLIFTSIIVVLNCDIQDHLWKVSSSLPQVCGILCISDFLRRIANLSKNPVSDSVFLENLKRLDYGSGMAQNFFYGYLRIVLPNTGDQEKGIIERIDDFISQQRLSEDSFPVKKLFILIPSSSYVPNDLKDCSFDWMKSAGTLEKMVRDRAGVKGRPYKNSVYRIKNPNDDNDKGIYVVAEGATPCKTLHEVVQYSGERKEFYKEHQKEIIFSFYETLRETLREDRDCRDLCEFVYYDGIDDFGLGNINVSKLILQKINEIKAREEFLSKNEKYMDEFGLNNVNVGLLLLQRIDEIQRREDFLRGVRDRNI